MKPQAAVRAHKQDLDPEYTRRLRDEIKWQIDTILPDYNREREEFRATIKARKGVMDRATFNKIRNCLHPLPRSGADQG